MHCGPRDERRKTCVLYVQGCVPQKLIVLGFRLPFTPPLFEVDIRGAARPGQNSLPLGDQAEFVDLKFPAPECLRMVQVCPAPGQNAGGPCCTTEVCNAHKTSLREVKYRWHPWHGKTVLVRGEACRGARVVLQCVRDELKGFPTLEIPEWMFDSCVCSRMYSTHPRQ